MSVLGRNATTNDRLLNWSESGPVIVLGSHSSSKQTRTPTHFKSQSLREFQCFPICSFLVPISSQQRYFRLRSPLENAPLAFLLELNLACAAKERAGEKITPPGLPLSSDKQKKFVTDDSIHSVPL